MHMQRCEKMKQRWATRCQECIKRQLLHCAMRIAENEASKRQAAQVVYIAISATDVAKALPRIVLLVDAPEVEQVGT